MIMIKVVYFYRKPLVDYFSIEEVFKNIRENLPRDIEDSEYQMPRTSTGLVNRIINVLHSAVNQREINHITGDVHYIALLLKKNKTLLTIHDLGILDKGSRLKKAVIKFFWFTMPARRVKYVTVISEFTKQKLLEHVSINPEKVKVIYDGISPLIKYTPYTFNKEKPNILQLGTAHNKNLERIIEAVKGLNIKLTILGNIREHQLPLLEKADIDYDNVYNLSYKEVIEQYKKADLVTFVSEYEGFGLPIIEANGVGRPVIAGNNTSMPEIAGDAALMVNSSNVMEIRNAITTLISDSRLREDLINKGKENVKRFDLKRISQQFADLYNQLTE